MLALLLVCVGAATASSGLAQDDAPIDPRADRVLRDMADYLASAPSFTNRARVFTDEEGTGGRLVEGERIVRIAVHRPDRLWADVRGPGTHKRFWYDGTTITIIDYRQNLYGMVEAPDDIDAALELLADRYDVVVPLTQFALNDPYAALRANAEAGSYVGLVDADGEQYHHLEFSQGSIDWQLWVENGPRPLPVRMVAVYTDQPLRPRMTAEFEDWDMANNLADGLFRFVAPAGAERVDVRPAPAD